MDRPRTSKTPVSEDQPEPGVEGALVAAGRFGLKSADAKKILREVFSVTSDWHKTARRLRLSASTVDAYATAFENSFATEAKLLLHK